MSPDIGHDLFEYRPLTIDSCHSTYYHSRHLHDPRRKMPNREVELNEFISQED